MDHYDDAFRLVVWAASDILEVFERPATETENIERQGHLLKYMLCKFVKLGQVFQKRYVVSVYCLLRQVQSFRSMPCRILSALCHLLPPPRIVPPLRSVRSPAPMPQGIGDIWQRIERAAT